MELDYTIAGLSKDIIVESINDTEIIKISVIDDDPKRAMVIANEIASVFNAEIVKLYNIQNVGIVDEAEITNAPYNVNLLKQLVISGLVGLVLGFGVVFVIYYFDTTVKTTEEIEKKLALPVIGVIPAIGGKKND